MYDYKEKLISADQLIDMVKTDMNIFTGFGFCAPKLFMDNLHKAAARGVRNVAFVCAVTPYYSEFMKPQYRNNFRILSFYQTLALRMALKGGANLTFTPSAMTHGWKRVNHLEGKVDMYVIATSMPDEHGYVSFSFDCMHSPVYAEQAKVLVFEMNPNFPRTMGDTQISLSEADYVLEVDYPAPQLPDEPATEVDEKIGEFIAQKVYDGDCIQVGIGALPNMICHKLIDKKDLGIHTEMMTSGLCELIKCGAANNSKKNLHRGKTVACFVCGNQELYDYIDDNPAFQCLCGDYTNDVRVVSKIDNFVSINSTLMVDFSGQASSESIGLDQISGTGGQLELCQAAQMSNGGRSFLCLHSTSSVKNKETGEIKIVSNIVPTLGAYPTVSCMRMDTHYIVTEYGIADLQGATFKERAKGLIAIAHPDFREELTKQAFAMGYLNDLDI
ncbi:MAG: acetyl-CoA hydrolase/transferase C-terminal domain-containing protein [Oscillospiraceae bacterium]|nr:acetyl-CoA hydrolase/transferase C-terminal domain-containing protein [Oscillospiraceae bacterium]